MIKVDGKLLVETVKTVRPIGADLFWLANKGAYGLLGVSSEAPNETGAAVARLVTPDQLKGAGGVVVKSEELVKTIKSFPKEPGLVVFEVTREGGENAYDPGVVQIRVGSLTSTVRGWSEGRGIEPPFPSMTASVASAALRSYLPGLTFEAFAAGLAHVLPAVSDDWNQPGKHRMAIQRGQLVGTDGHRLHARQLVPTDQADDRDWLMGQPVAVVAKAACDQLQGAGLAAPFYLRQKGDVAHALIGRWILESFTGDQSFPEWRRLLNAARPEGTRTCAVVLASSSMEQLRDTLKSEIRAQGGGGASVQLVVRDDAFIVRGKKAVTFSALSIQHEKEWSGTGDDWELTQVFSSAYLLEALGPLVGRGKITLGITDGFPLRIDGGDFLGLVAHAPLKPGDGPWEVPETAKGATTGRFLRCFTKDLRDALAVVKERQGGYEKPARVFLRVRDAGIAACWASVDPTSRTAEEQKKDYYPSWRGIEIGLPGGSTAGSDGPLMASLLLDSLKKALAGAEGQITFTELAPLAEGLGPRLLLEGDVTPTDLSEFDRPGPVVLPSDGRIDLLGADEDPKKLAKAIDFVLPAVSSDRGRPHLNGVCFELDESGVAYVVGTDGHRMHVYPMQTDDAINQNTPAPKAELLLDLAGVWSLQRLFKLFKGAPVALTHAVRTIQEDAKHTRTVELVSVVVGTARIDSEIGAKFPPWRRILPRGNDTTMVLKLQADKPLREFLAQAGKLQKNTLSPWVKMKIVIDEREGTVKLSATDSDSAVSIETTVKVEVADYQGTSELIIAANPNYLLDALSGAEEVWIEFQGPTDAIAIRYTESGEGSLAIVMPHRL